MGNLQYSKTVIEHGTNPTNMKIIHSADGQAIITGSCGDTMEMYLCVSRDKIIVDASFSTDGCISSISAGSMTVKMAIGQPLFAAKAITQNDVLKQLGGLPDENEHCALLAVKTLYAAIDDFARMSSQPWKRMYRSK